MHFKGPLNNYVTTWGGWGVKRWVTDRSQHNVKKRYEGGGGVKNLSKKRYVIVEQPIIAYRLFIDEMCALF